MYSLAHIIRTIKTLVVACGGQIFMLTNVHNMTRVHGNVGILAWSFNININNTSVVNDNYEHLFAPCKAS